MKHSVKVLTRVLLSDRQVAMLATQRRSVVIDDSGGSESDENNTLGSLLHDSAQVQEPVYFRS